MDNKNEIYTRL